MIKKLAFFTLAAAVLVATVSLGSSYIPAIGFGISRPIIAVDAGHGGQDGGTISISGVKESDINLAISKRLEYLLALSGAAVVMTRDSDDHLGGDSFNKAADIKKRLEIARDSGCNLLVSIHQNHYTDPRYGGAQVFFGAAGDSQGLAAITQENLRLALDESNDRKIKSGTQAAYLLKNAKCEAMIVECGFLSNSTDVALLQMEDYQKKTAMAVAASVMYYIGENK